MNYQSIHDQIIERARKRERPDGYCERHHIVMRSMGGSDEQANLVWLTGREHYLVHWLLFKIYRNKQTVFAWNRMTFGRKTLGRYHSTTFEYARKAKAEIQGALFKGRKLSPEHRAKMSAAKKGRTYADMGREPSSPLKGRQMSDEHKARCSQAVRGRKASDETRKKLSASKMGSLNPRFGKPSWNSKQRLKETA
jgi:hypothetical protein